MSFQTSLDLAWTGAGPGLPSCVLKTTNGSNSQNITESSVASVLKNEPVQRWPEKSIIYSLQREMQIILKTQRRVK